MDCELMKRDKNATTNWRSEWIDERKKVVELKAKLADAEEIIRRQQAEFNASAMEFHRLSERCFEEREEAVREINMLRKEISEHKN